MSHTDDLDELLASIELEEWLDYEGISYRKAGNGNLKLAECPWCGEGNRIYISANNKRGLCFRASCGQKFNLFSLARQHLSTDNKGTVEHFRTYAKRQGIVVHRPAPALAPEPSDGGWKLPESVPLPTPEGYTHPYLTGRHITLETQARFGLRWCERGMHNYVDSYGRERSQDFSQRILIPVVDLDGELKSYQGRATWHVDEEAGERRYLFPMNLPGTGRFLYGGHLIRGVPNLTMGEGPPDTWAIHQAIDGHPDFKNWGAIGSFGLNIGASDEQGDDQLGRLRQLKREGLSQVVICWDGERNALLHALEAANLLYRERLLVKIALMPPGKDPNEVETRVVREAIENAEIFTPSLYMIWKIASPYVS